MNTQSRSVKKDSLSVRYVARNVHSVGGSYEPLRVVQRQPTKRTKRTRISDQFDNTHQNPGSERRPLDPVSDT
jgi:hypothetical protein